MTEQFANPSSDELSDALCDLQKASDEAREGGFSLPFDLALANADRLLRELYRISPRRYEVYPTQDGEIAIDALGRTGRSVVSLRDSHGGALCLVNINGKHRRARYKTAEGLPDDFFLQALDELWQEGDGGPVSTQSTKRSVTCVSLADNRKPKGID